MAGHALRTFTLVAAKRSLTQAAIELGLTKGAISHQLRTLENQLGFKLLERLPRGVTLTHKGQMLFDASSTAFGAIDRQVDSLRTVSGRSVTLGLSTYLASRWLSPKLMRFLQTHPTIRLRIQPMIDVHDLEREGVDIAIRWGKGNWTDMETELLFDCPAFPAVAPGALQSAAVADPLGVLAQLPLLHDREDSSAWDDWFVEAGIRLDNGTATLTIHDPNVRVQAVIDGQGVALFDRFVDAEITAGKLQRITPHELRSYGYYLAYRPDKLANPDVAALARWLKQVAV